MPKRKEHPLDYCTVTVPVLFTCAGTNIESILPLIVKRLEYLGEKRYINGYDISKLKKRCL